MRRILAYSIISLVIVPLSAGEFWPGAVTCFAGELKANGAEAVLTAGTETPHCTRPENTGPFSGRTIVDALLDSGAIVEGAALSMPSGTSQSTAGSNCFHRPAVHLRL